MSWPNHVRSASTADVIVGDSYLRNVESGICNYVTVEIESQCVVHVSIICIIKVASYVTLLYDHASQTTAGKLGPGY